MQKLFRSLIAIGGLAGLVACGDDVSITPPPPPPLTISGAPVTAIQVGDVVQLSASAAANWSSSNSSVASVDGTGRVTAVGAGVASITATSQADATQSASVTITVAAEVPTTISVQNITVTGTAGQTVNLNNVTGSIDVNLNVEPGDNVVESVEVLIDGVVACTQDLGGAQAAAAVSAEADVEATNAVIVSCQINTADFDQATGVADFFNGPHTLSARANIAGGSQVATPSTQLVFNNASGVVAVVTNNNAGDPASAINPATGLAWIGGSITLDVTGVSYVSGTTVASVTLNLFGKTPVIALTNGKGSVTWSDATVWTAANSGVGNYLSTVAENVTFAGAVLSNGQPLVSGTPLLNFGAPGATNAAMPPLDVVRLDNTAPGVTSANAVVQPAIAINPASLGVWVNAATTFSAGTVGIPSTSTLNASDLGADAVTVTVHVGPTLTGASGSCNVTGLTATTDASSLAETIVSTAYRGRVVFKDALGNQACADLAPGTVVSGTFGADFTPPANVTLAFSDASTDSMTYAAVSPAVTYILASTGDNASGISPTTPGLVSILVTEEDGSTTCVVGSGSSCAQVAAAGTDNITGGSALEGYYDLTAQLTDVAGNPAPVPPFMRVYLVDATAPAFTGNVGMNAQYAGNAPATFTNLNVTDNLDLNELYGVVDYTAAGIMLQYPSLSIGSFGLPLEQSFSGDYTIPSLIRCINPANTFAVNAGAEATQITFTASDQAGNTGTVAPVVGALQAALDNCGAVGNLTAPAAINTFDDVAPAYGTGKTQVSKSGSTSGANAATVTLSAVADVTLDNAPEPFTRVEFYYENAAGNYVLIGQAGAGVLNQTVTNRTWTYTFSWDPGAEVPTNAALPVIAIGIDAQGDAVRTAGVTVNVAN
jgi:hypothetical protein